MDPRTPQQLDNPSNSNQCLPRLQAMSTQLCKYCARFTNDFTEKYNAWLRSGERGPDSFQVICDLKDRFPKLRKLTRTAEAGCGLCAAIEAAAQRQRRDHKASFRKNRGLEQVWNQIEWPRASFKILELMGTFYFESTGISASTPPATGIQFQVKHSKRPGEYPFIEYFPLNFKILGVGSGTNRVNPPLIRAPSQDALSPENVTMVKKWLHDCTHEHPDCRTARKTAFLPCRLICTVPGNIRIIGTRNFRETNIVSIEYIALSHCWGNVAQEYKTTTKNLMARMSGLDTQQLPQNLKDAITVAQTLAIDYLWIDSICIVQNSIPDLETEMKDMLEIYGCAYLTITATSAADSHGGFLTRPERPHILINRPYSTEKTVSQDGMLIRTDPVFSLSLEAIWQDAIGDSPWDQRAWTLQESLTAHRVLHFTKEGLFFECATLDYFEGCDISRPQKQASPNFLRNQGLVAGPGSHRPDREKMFVEYYGLVEKYTKRALTFISDKAVAFSSITTAITRITKSEARHGLLLSDIRRGLLWEGSSYREKGLNPRLTQWPSWSWLSFPGDVRFLTVSSTSGVNEEEVTKDALSGMENEGLDQQMRVLNLDNERALRINAFLTNVTIAKRLLIDQHSFKIEFRGKDVGQISFDGTEDCTELRRVTLLSLGESEAEKKGGMHLFRGSSAYRGLVVVPNGGDSYRRVGTFLLLDDDEEAKQKDSRWIFDNIPRTVVTLT